jgi:hypothetical protein
VKHILLECKETKYWREKLIHDKWLHLNKEYDYNYLHQKMHNYFFIKHTPYLNHLVHTVRVLLEHEVAGCA